MEGEGRPDGAAARDAEEPGAEGVPCAGPGPCRGQARVRGGWWGLGKGALCPGAPLCQPAGAPWTWGPSPCPGGGAAPMRSRGSSAWFPCHLGERAAPGLREGPVGGVNLWGLGCGSLAFTCVPRGPCHPGACEVGGGHTWARARVAQGSGLLLSPAGGAPGRQLRLTVMPWNVPPPPFECLLLFYMIMMQLYIQEVEERHAAPPPRQYHARIPNPPVADLSCVQEYRLDRGAVEELCQLVGAELQAHAETRRTIPVTQKVLMALKYLGTGSFQGDVARHHGTSQSSASRCLDAFLDAMLLHVPAFIAFPTADAELARVREGFYAIAGFPNVVSAVDATHVGILAPTDTPAIYRNRHRQHSMNIQATCDAQALFTSVTAKFPGSVHDAQVFEGSGVRGILESWPEGRGWLLGDRAYPLRPYLLTPYAQDAPGPVGRYNVAHRRTRLVIERAFGMLKMRFRCLHLTGGRLMRTPEKASKVSVVCAMLHNMCLRRRIPLLQAEEEEGAQGGMEVPAEEERRALRRGGQDPRGLATRAHVTAAYFSH